ncbi:MAG: hypothetical protein M3083_10975 [Actinomycetota bacterium]|nr:hypothetical protein [Actinomycetota bacterium]
MRVASISNLSHVEGARPSPAMAGNGMITLAGAGARSGTGWGRMRDGALDRWSWTDRSPLAGVR